MDQILIIDFQGFDIDSPYDHYVIKELSALSGFRSDLWLMRPPYDEKMLDLENRRKNMITSISVHGFSWRDGSCPYDNVTRIIKERCKNFEKIYVPNKQKARVLQNIIQKDVIPVEEMFNIKLRDLPSSQLECWYDHKGYECAYKNTDNLMRWFLQSGELVAPNRQN